MLQSSFPRGTFLSYLENSPGGTFIPAGTLISHTRINLNQLGSLESLDLSTIFDSNLFGCTVMLRTLQVR